MKTPWGLQLTWEPPPLSGYQRRADAQGKGRVLATSCATGPAFEGATLSCGMQAVPGAVDRGRIDPVTGLPAYTVIMEKKAAGASGIRPVSLSQKDIRAVQLGKAALMTGIEFLCREAGLEKPSEILIAGAFGSHQHLGHADDGIQNIIEIMGNAPCKASDGFHFLRLEEVLFHFFPVGNILIHKCPSINRAGLVQYGEIFPEHPPKNAVGPDNPVFKFENLAYSTISSSKTYEHNMGLKAL